MVMKTSSMHHHQTTASADIKKRKKYKGVRMRSWGSWVSEIRAPVQKTRIWLGSYSTAEAAARAYDAALLCLKGSAANLNFPEANSLRVPDTVMSPKSIQRIAAAAAAAVGGGPLCSASESPPRAAEWVEEGVVLTPLQVAQGLHGFEFEGFYGGDGEVGFDAGVAEEEAVWSLW